MDKLIKNWFSLLAFCRSKEFSKDKFKQDHDAWAKAWSRLSWEDQGCVSEQIGNKLKCVIDESAPW